MEARYLTVSHECCDERLAQTDDLDDWGMRCDPGCLEHGTSTESGHCLEHDHRVCICCGSANVPIDDDCHMAQLCYECADYSATKAPK